jgi:sulfur carrier protein ThiS adenylyltransferase
MELYPQRREEFRRALAAAGFEREEGEGVEVWRGPLLARWIDPASGDPAQEEHFVRVKLPTGFPFRKPVVFPDSASPLSLDARHRVSVEGGALCLWPDTDQRGMGWAWSPAITPEEFLDRIREWLARYHVGDWAPEDRPPDLHLHFPQPASRTLMLISDDWLPPRDVEFGRFGVWENKSGRYGLAGHPVAGAAEVARKHNDRILAALVVDGGRFSRPAAWFRLLREPKPCRNLRELIDEIDAATAHEPGWAAARLARLFDAPPYRSPTVIIGLGYSDETGEGERWLFLRVEQHGYRPLKFGRPEFTENNRIFSFETAPCGRQDLMRRTGHIAETLTGKKVLLLGIGALGSSVAMLLAKAGVPWMRITDGDRMRPTNAVRHQAGLLSIGQLKTHATLWEVLQHVPDCTVVTDFESWDPEELATWISEVDVVVDATTHETFSLLVNELAIRAGKPVVYTFTQRRAAIGQVIIVRPSIDPCLLCHTRLVAAEGYPVIPPGEEGDFVETGCGIPTVQASAVDIEATANAAARAALRILQGRADARNHLLLVHEPLPDGAGVVSCEGVHSFTWTKVPCTACGEVPA